MNAHVLARSCICSCELRDEVVAAPKLGICPRQVLLYDSVIQSDAWIDGVWIVQGPSLTVLYLGECLGLFGTTDIKRM